MKLNIHLQQGANIKHISVSGEIESPEDIAIFFNELDEYTKIKYSITFMNVCVLNAEIINKLHSLQRESRCKVYVFKRFLYTYLFGLGVKAEYITRKSLHMIGENSFSREEPTEGSVLSFLEKLRVKYGYDYTEYQIESLIRRIKIAMLRENIKCFAQFEAIVLSDSEIFDQLFLDFSINTTQFFRDSEVFLSLRNKVLPYLSSYSHIKIWSAGCSNGKEPYSLAILLDELGLLNRSYIYATDINPYVVEEAKNGLFSTHEIDKDILNYQRAGGQKGFVDYFELKDSFMAVKPQLRKNILFFQHSVIGDGILNEFQLILCRNLLIYMTPSLQHKVLSTFSKSLDRAGFLVLGKSESLRLNCGEALFSNYIEKDRIFRPK